MPHEITLIILCSNKVKGLIFLDIDWKEFFSLKFSDIFGMILSFGSIIYSSKIPNAILRYKMEADFKNQTESIKLQINKLRNGRNITADKLVIAFNQTVEYLNVFSKYVELRLRLKILFLNLNYKFMSKKYRDSNLDKIKLIRLMDKYSSLIDIISQKIGD